MEEEKEYCSLHVFVPGDSPESAGKAFKGFIEEVQQTIREARKKSFIPSSNIRLVKTKTKWPGSFAVMVCLDKTEK